MEHVAVETRENVKVDYVEQQDLVGFIDEVFEAVVNTFRFTDEELQWFTQNKIAKLIAAIPYVAGCEDAKRTALAHVAIYLTELRGGSIIFDHCEDDNTSVYSRLRLISSFKGGDEKVIKHGMNLLSLCMLEGYKKSATQDSIDDVYNPLNDRSWDYDFLKINLENEIKENFCKEIDTLTFLENGSLGRRWS